MKRGQVARAWLAAYVSIVPLVACHTSQDSSMLFDGGGENQGVQTTPANFGGPCTSDGGCAGGICATYLPGGVCVLSCADLPCPPGSICTDVAADVTASSLVCVPDCDHCTRAGFTCAAVTFQGPEACAPSCATTGNCMAHGLGEEGDASIVNPSMLDGGTARLPATDAGTFIPLATQLDYPTSLLIEGDTLYTALDDGAGGIFSIPASGGIPTLVSAAPDAFLLASNGTDLLWVGATDGGTINEAALDGGALQSLAFEDCAPAALTTGLRDVYWACADPGTIYSVPAGGGPVSTIATGQAAPAALALDGPNLYWANRGTWSGTTYNEDGAIIELRLDGGAPQTLATDQLWPQALAVTPDSVYWANAGSCVLNPLTNTVHVTSATGSIAETSTAGGTIVTLANSQDDPLALWSTGPELYWLNHGVEPGAGALAAVSLPDAPPRVLVWSLMFPVGLVVAGNAVFFTERGTDGTDGTIDLFTPGGSSQP